LALESYIIAWSVYLISAGGLIATAWTIAKTFQSSDARRLMLSLVSVFILMPWYVSEGQSYLAPAFLVALLDAVTESVQQASRAGVPLLAGLILCVFINVLASWLLRLINPEKSSASS